MTTTLDNRRLVPLSEIRVGKRLREDYGDIDALAKSIETLGLFHPLVVDEENRLLAGHRRLKALRLLKRDVAPVRRLSDLSRDERKLVELEENLRRKDLTPFERSKGTVKLAETAKKVAKAEAQQNGDLLPHLGRKSRGRPREPGSGPDLAERTGIPRATTEKATQHVATAEAFPWMQGKTWTQNHVLKAHKLLAGLPKADVQKVDALITEQPLPVPTDEALKILTRWSRLTTQQRATIHKLHRSKDERERSLALTTAVELAPLPDPRAVEIKNMASSMRRLAKRFKGDAHNNSILAWADKIDSWANQLQTAHEKKARSLTR